MKSKTLVRQTLAIVLSLALVLPGTAYGGGKSGKKNFKEGVKYAASQQWDLAAQEFALAVAAEPDNAEYRLHYARALQQASIMFLKRGDTLADQKDFASAYNAYRQSFAYDPSNEMAMVKMKRMLELQKAATNTGETISYNPHTGNILPASTDVRMAYKPSTLEKQKVITIRDEGMKAWMTRMGRQLGLNVIFDETVRDTRVTLELTDVSWARAFDLLLLQTKNTYELIDRKTIFVYPDNATNKQKFERLMIKTFYLGNAKHTDVRAAIQGLISTAGGGRQIASLEHVNALIVRATPAELQLVQEIIKTIDKNKAEVVVDVNIYEVSRSDSLQIGNQIATTAQQVTETRFDNDGQPVTVTTGNSASLANLGGIGQVLSIAGNTFNPFLGGVGTLFGLPPSSLSLLQGRGRSRLRYNSQIHALDGQQNKTKVGRSVPVRTGTNYGYGSPVITTPGQGGNNQNQLNQLGGLGYGGGLFDNIQYKDVGLVIDITPTITTEGYVEIKMNLESTDTAASSETSNLTPVFTQRSLSTTARVLDGVTAVVAGVRQDTKSDSRATIPVIGLVPILGRFFTSPKETSDETDLVITVTPHIIRAPEINKPDHLAQLSGPMQGGIPRSLEDVVMQIQEDEQEEKRMIASRQGAPSASPASSPAAPTGTTPASNTGSLIVNTASTGAVSNSAAANAIPRTYTQPAQNVPVQDASFTQPPRANTPTNTPTDPNNPATDPNKPAADPAANNGQPGGQANEAAGEKPAGEAGQAGEKGATPEGEAQGGEKKEGDAAAAQQNEASAQVGAPQARVLPPEWPEHVRRAAEREIAEAAERRKREAAQSKPAPEIPAEYLQQQRQQKPAPIATIRPGGRPTNRGAGDAAAGNPTEAAPINLTLATQNGEPNVSKPVFIAVMGSGFKEFSNAVLHFKFDPKKLRVASVRAGSILGQSGDIIHQLSGGDLRVTIGLTDGGKVAAGDGSLIIIEVIPVEAGQTQLEAVAGTSQIQLTGNRVAKINAVPVKMTIK